VFILRQDVERLQHESKKQLGEIKALTARFEQTEAQLKNSQEAKAHLKSESNKVIQQLKQQLLGAVRRINYLVEEKKKVE